MSYELFGTYRWVPAVAVGDIHVSALDVKNSPQVSLDGWCNCSGAFSQSCSRVDLLCTSSFPE